MDLYFFLRPGLVPGVGDPAVMNKFLLCILIIYIRTQLGYKNKMEGPNLIQIPLVMKKYPLFFLFKIGKFDQIIQISLSQWIY